MIQLTETAITKVCEIMSQQEPKPQGLRISVVGGGCSGFQYSMAFENSKMPLDKEYKFGEGLRVFVDQASMLYLDNCRVDYVETMEGAGFKFENPNSKNVVVFFGDFSDGVVSYNGIGIPAHPIITWCIRQFLCKVGNFCLWQNEIMRTVRIGYPLVKARV